MPSHTLNCEAVAFGPDIFVIGGDAYGAVGVGTQSTYRFNLATLEWTQEEDIPEVGAYFACGTLDEAIYCSGAKLTDPVTVVSGSIHKFNTNARSWTTLSQQISLNGTSRAIALNVYNKLYFFHGQEVTYLEDDSNVQVVTDPQMTSNNMISGFVYTSFIEENNAGEDWGEWLQSKFLENVLAKLGQ